IAEGAVVTWGNPAGTWVAGTLKALAKHFEFSLTTPWKKLPARVQRLLLQGSGDEEVRFEFHTRKGSAFIHRSAYEGILPGLARRYRETTSDAARAHIASLMHTQACPECKGARLRRESLAVRIAGRNIGEWSALSVSTAREQLGALTFDGVQERIAEPIMKELM